MQNVKSKDVETPPPVASNAKKDEISLDHEEGGSAIADKVDDKRAMKSSSLTKRKDLLKVFKSEPGLVFPLARPYYLDKIGLLYILDKSCSGCSGLSMGT